MQKPGVPYIMISDREATRQKATRGDLQPIFEAAGYSTDFDDDDGLIVHGDTYLTFVRLSEDGEKLTMAYIFKVDRNVAAMDLRNGVNQFNVVHSFVKAYFVEQEESNRYIIIEYDMSLIHGLRPLDMVSGFRTMAATVADSTELNELFEL